MVVQREITSGVIQILKERHSLASTLSDTRAVFHKLDLVLKIFLSVIVAFIWLLLLGSELGETIITASSLFLGSALAFGGSIKSIFESMVFIFGFHPYDVGDRCMIDGVAYTVLKIELLLTTFTTFDQGVVSIPHSSLIQSKITNNRRSGNRRDRVVLIINMKTPVEKIDRFKEDYQRFLLQESLLYDPEFLLVFEGVDLTTNMLTLSLWITHRDNWQSPIDYGKLRSKTVITARQLLLQHEITFDLLPVPVDFLVHPKEEEENHR